MAISTFIGRETELKKLAERLTQAGQGHGGIVFVEGEAGTGKSLFMQAVQEQAVQIPSAARTRFVQGSCYEDLSGQSAYQPFIEVLEMLTKASTEGKDAVDFILDIVKETGEDWLGLIPGLGSVAKVGLMAGKWLLDREGKSAQAQTLPVQYVVTISRIAERYAPLVLIIEDAHWIDDASCRLLQRLAQRARSQPLLIVLTYRPSFVTETHPLRNVSNELRIKNLVDVIRLGNFTELEINTYVLSRFGAAVHPQLVPWLLHLCGGHPLFVAQYLSLLEQLRIIQNVNGKYALDGGIKFVNGEWELSGRLATAAIPDSIEALLAQRIERIEKDDRKMLQLGAVQGERFMASVLSGLLKKDELDILERLRIVIDTHHVITLYTGEDSDQTRSATYSFEHALLQRALYNKLSPPERVRYHHNIAQFLAPIAEAELTRMASDAIAPSRKLVLEVAHHFELGNAPPMAAHYYYQAAQLLLASGANNEAVEAARRALQNVRQSKDAHALHADILILLLIASQTRWRKQEHALEEPVMTLIEEAKVHAAHVQNPKLMAHVISLEALALYGLNNMTLALTKYEEALALIRETKDRIGQYAVMSQYGHHLCGQNLRAGLDMQYAAQKLLTTMVPAGGNVPANLKRHSLNAQCGLGIGEFDLGNYGLARTLLEQAIAELRESHFQEDLFWASNYLAQVYVATGAYEHAEALLNEILKQDKAADEPSDWYGMNLALLGKLYFEWDRISDAEEFLYQALKESERTQLKWQLPLVRNYYVEVLLHPKQVEQRCAEAELSLQLNLKETSASSFYRSTVAALSLSALTALAQGKFDAAIGFSTRAVKVLQDMGDLPALRTEEVMYNHYLVLSKAGRSQEAQPYLEQAHKMLQKKADSLTDAGLRKSFLERPSLSRKIIVALNGD